MISGDFGISKITIIFAEKNNDSNDVRPVLSGKWYLI